MIVIYFEEDVMNIVIVGAGKVGQVLCHDLSYENHNITLIEINSDLLEEMLNEHDINGVAGNGSSYEIQVEAGVEKADIFIAVTDNDELNLIAAVLAKNIGAETTIARARKEEYIYLNGPVRRSLGINHIVNPELEAAEYIRRLITFPQAISYESFTSKDEAPIVEMRVSPDSNLVGKMLIQFRNLYKNILVCAVSDGDKVFIPNGDYAIKSGDHLFVIGPIEEISKLFLENKQTSKTIKSILIIGGGLLSRYILKVLNDTNIKIKLIEKDREKAEYISLNFPKVEVINDDGTSSKTLKEQRADRYDALFALTGIDEENMIVSMVAQKYNIGKTLTKISRTELNDLGDLIGLQSIVTPKRIIADKILQKIRALENSQGSNVEALYKMANDQVEALEFIVRETSKVTGIKLKDLPIKNGNLLAFIKRNNEVLFPSGEDTIEVNDRVILVTQNEGLNELDEILL